MENGRESMFIASSDSGDLFDVFSSPLSFLSRLLFDLNNEEDIKIIREFRRCIIDTMITLIETKKYCEYFLEHAITNKISVITDITNFIQTLRNHAEVLRSTQEK